MRSRQRVVHQLGSAIGETAHVLDHFCGDGERNLQREACMTEFPTEGSLTPDERARLDPRIKVERLETLLRRTPPALRAIVLNSCYLEPETDSYTVTGAVDPEIDQLWRQVWGITEADGEAPPA